MPEKTDIPTLRSRPPDNGDILIGKSALIFDALSLIERARNSTARQIAVKDWENIDEEKSNEYDTVNKKGVRKREGNLLHIAEQKTMSKVKALNFKIHGNGADENEEYVFGRGVQTIEDKGGLPEALKGRRGAIQAVAMKGDSMIEIMIQPSDTYPIKHKVLQMDRVYIDPSADSLFTRGGLMGADEIMIIDKMPYDVYLRDFAKFGNVKLAALGNLPTSEVLNSMIEFDGQEIEEQMIEVGRYFKLSKGAYGILVGSSATPLLEIVESDGQGKFPYKKDKKNVFPIMPLHGWAKTKGYYSYALGHLLIKEAQQRRRMDNWAEWGMTRNIKGLGIVRLPPGMSKSKFMGRYRMALQSLANGRDGMIVMENNGITDTRTVIDKFVTEPVSQEYERFSSASDLRVKRIGIPLDEIDRAASESATQTIAEEKRADIFAQEFMRMNAGNFQWLREFEIEIISKYIKETDDTPVDMVVEVPIGEKLATAFALEQNLSPNAIPSIAARKIRPQVTMGNLASAAKNRYWFVEMDELSGVIKSSSQAIAEVRESLAFIPPNSPAFNEQLQRLVHLLGQDINITQEAVTPAGGTGEDADKQAAIPKDKSIIAPKELTNAAI